MSGVDILKNGLAIGFLLNLLFAFATYKLEIFFPKWLGNSFAFMIFAVPLFLYWKYRHHSRIEEFNFLRQKDNLLEEVKKQNIADNKNILEKEFDFDENGHYRILPSYSCQHEILVKIPKRTRRELFKLQYIALDKQGNYVFCIKDQFGTENRVFYQDINSLITSAYTNKAYRTLDEFVQNVHGSVTFWVFNRLRKKYFKYLNL